MKDYIIAFKNIFNYKDEATIKEFWNFFVFNIIMNIVIRNLVKYLNIPEMAHNVYIIIVTLTLFSIGFRRLKNAGYSGFLFFIPFLNLVFALLPEKKNNN